MSWNVQEIIRIYSNGKEKPTGKYTVSNQLGGEPSLTFNNKSEAVEWATLLNKKDKYIAALETVLEMQYDEDLTEIKKEIE